MNLAKYQAIRQRQRGLSMIEILISVLILSIGLLGIAGLQGTSLKSTRSASLRTQAIILSQGIIENMHSNKVEALANSYSIALGSTATTPTNNCLTTACTPAELAQFDLFNWWQKVHDTQNASNESKFPLSTASIAVDNVGLVTVSIIWRDNVKQNVKNPAQAVDVFTTFSITSML